jgi:hypothetical protein
MRNLDPEDMALLKKRQLWKSILVDSIFVVIVLFIWYILYKDIQVFRTQEPPPPEVTYESSTTKDESGVISGVTGESLVIQGSVMIPDVPVPTTKSEEPYLPAVSTSTVDFELPNSITDNNEFWVCSGTVYNLTVEQCDGDPGSPACSGFHLDEDAARSLEYIAISRNLLSRNTPGAPFDCGETVYVTGMIPEWLNGYKTIVDVSGSYRNHVDFLTPMTINTGRSSNVRIYKLE